MRVAIFAGAMGTAAAYKPAPAEHHESATADSWAPAKIATRIRVHLAVDAPTPEARYFQATGRYPCDD